MSQALAAKQSFGSRLWKGWIRPIAMALIVVSTFRSAVADWNDVPSQSMEPTILVGDRIFVNKLAYDLKVPFTTWHLATWGDPDRGDIVVFYAPATGQRMVKRVVGLPGDRIEMRNNRLVINGQQVGYRPLAGAAPSPGDLTDPAPHQFALERLGAIAHDLMMQPNRSAQRSFGPVIVPKDKYFVMGDNRDNSGDSRVFGYVPRSQIVGEAVGLALSFDHKASYSPRWRRFFRGF